MESYEESLQRFIVNQVGYKKITQRIQQTKNHFYICFHLSSWEMRVLLVVVFWLDVMWFNPYQNWICSEICVFKWMSHFTFFPIRFPSISLAIDCKTDFFYYAQFLQVHNKCAQIYYFHRKMYRLSIKNRYSLGKNSCVDGDAISDLPAEVLLARSSIEWFPLLLRETAIVGKGSRIHTCTYSLPYLLCRTEGCVTHTHKHINRRHLKFGSWRVF